MTKEEREKAIEKLVNATFSEEWQGDEELTTAYNMAINALDHSGEYINRFDAIIQLSHDLPTCPLPKIKECLDKMPTLNDELINFHNCEHKKGEREKAIEIFIKRAKCRATASGDIIEGTDKKCSETACDQCPLFYNDDEMYEAERIALKALKREHCEDAISRSRLKECFHRNVVNGEAFDDLIDAQPNVTPTREHGEWIKVTNGRGGHECSQCGNYAPSYQSGAENLSDFCPKCGADMRGTKLPHTDKSGLEYADQPTLRSAT